MLSHINKKQHRNVQHLSNIYRHDYSCQWGMWWSSWDYEILNGAMTEVLAYYWTVGEAIGTIPHGPCASNGHAVRPVHIWQSVYTRNLPVLSGKVRENPTVWHWLWSDFEVIDSDFEATFRYDSLVNRLIQWVWPKIIYIIAVILGKSFNSLKGNFEGLPNILRQRLWYILRNSLLWSTPSCFRQYHVKYV